MNFMDTPIPGLVPNQESTGTALEAAMSFTDELINLGLLGLAEGHYEVVNNFPLFFIEKLGQPGQYRGIADGKAGGQNVMCVGGSMPNDQSRLHSTPSLHKWMVRSHRCIKVLPYVYHQRGRKEVFGSNTSTR